MDGTDEITTRDRTPTRGKCTVDGCPCKDARIVSFRRAAFYAARARVNGETADRVVAIEDGWQLPTPLG
jgi:hypothetical protein